jgi:hypothetical protein
MLHCVPLMGFTMRRCRFWPEGRQALWEEKLQLREPFRGNQATVWGTKQVRQLPEGCTLRFQSAKIHAMEVWQILCIRWEEDCSALGCGLSAAALGHDVLTALDAECGRRCLFWRGRRRSRWRATWR